ncbi:MAG: hypothetical protein ACI86S_001233, partial [Paracoccaceae bacterium]
SGFLFAFGAANQHTIMKRFQSHHAAPLACCFITPSRGC